MTDQSQRVLNMLKEISKPGANPGGVDTLVKMLAGVDRQTERRILDTLQKQNPLLWEEIKEKHFSFEDLLTLRDAVVKKALAEIHSSTLAVALIGAADPIKAKIFQNLSQRASMRLQEDIQMLGPKPRALVDQAQREITQVFRRWRHVIL